LLTVWPFSSSKGWSSLVPNTTLGIPLFDDVFGGVYRNRQVLCCGRAGSGKSILGLHFIHQALVEGDRALLLSGYRATDALIISESFGMPFADAVASGQLVLLEYASFITENASSHNILLPPQAFEELQETIESQSIRRVVLDTVLPWLAIQPISRLVQHLYSFVHALDRIGATVLLTLPKPVSNAAFLLKNKLDDLCPVSITLDHTNQTDRVMRVSKYLGEIQNLSKPMPFAIHSGKGFVLPADPTSSPATHPGPAASVGNRASTQPPAKPAAPASPKKPIAFSSVVRMPDQR
jgi:KaiC/GvpD/RAD55 family RecA-like ATPase